MTDVKGIDVAELRTISEVFADLSPGYVELRIREAATEIESLRKQLATVRDDTLEQAAKVFSSEDITGRFIQAQIRALKGKQR